MWSLRKLAFVFVVFAMGAPLPASAQRLSPELQALDAALPGALVNDPSNLNWESYGPDFYTEGFRDKDIPGGAGRRFHVNRAGRNIYDSGTNIPLIRRVRRGEDVTIGFYARTVEADTNDGKGVLRVRFQESVPPFEGFGETMLRIDTNWRWYEVTAKARQTLRTKDGIVAIHFGNTRQILEIGQTIVVSGATSIATTPEPAASPSPKSNAAEDSDLPEPLQGLGDLLNDPNDRDWTIAAEGGTTDSRNDATIWLGRATRLATSASEPGKIVARVNVPGATRAGQKIIVAVVAKTVNTQRPEGAAIMAVGLAAPGDARPPRISKAALKTDWQLIRLETTAPELPAGDAAQVEIVVEGTGETIDIGPIYILGLESAPSENE